MNTLNYNKMNFFFVTLLFFISCTPTKNASTNLASTNLVSTNEKPNIVFILCDDLGYGEIQSLAPATSKIKTPHVDQLTKEGMVFTDAHSGSSVCTPTRYGIMTGRYSWRTSLQSGVVSGFKPDLIKEDRPTIGNFLKDQGYHTAIIGKWHLNFQYADPATKALLRKKGRKLPPVGSTIPDGPINRGVITRLSLENGTLTFNMQILLRKHYFEKKVESYLR